MKNLLYCLVTGFALTGAVHAEDPKPATVGNKAPAFKLPGSDGKTYTLDQFKGKKAVIIAWFPKAKTGG